MCEYQLSKWTSVQLWQCEAVGDRSLARRMDKLRRLKPVTHCQCHRQCSWFRPRRLWSLLNRFRTGQGLCAANLHLWGLRADPFCECGLRQSMTHIIEVCHLTRLQGGLRAHQSADEAAVVWLDKTSKR